jgi:fructose-1,6-bisphosphatase
MLGNLRWLIQWVSGAFGISKNLMEKGHHKSCSSEEAGKPMPYQIPESKYLVAIMPMDGIESFGRAMLEPL